MANDLEEELQEVEASWPKTKELAFVIDDPLEKLMEKARQIFKGRHHDTLDALAVRIADACPGGVTEINFGVAEPIAGACKKYFANIEKLRTGLNRPFLDAKKAVDDAAKATVARAEPTLTPIINAVKKIQDKRKWEEEARAEAERRRIEDERLAAEKAHRDMIEAEHAAEKKRLADQAAADRKQAEDLAAKNRQANEELRELRQQIEKMGRTEVKDTSEIAKIVASPPVGKMVAMDDHGYPILPKAPMPNFDDAPSLPPFDLPMENFVQSVHSDVKTESDMQMVRQLGNDIAAFKDGIHRPPCIRQEAKQAVELAVFDLCEISKRLQEWSMA